MAERSDPLSFEEPIVDDGGRPTPFFMQQWSAQLNVNGYAFNLITAGGALSGGGALADGDVTISLDALTPSPAGNYGSSTQVPVVTIDEYGRITAASTASVAATVAVEDDGTPFGSFTTFDFVGTEWTLTDAGSGVLQIEVTASGGISGIDVEDEGSPVGTNFTTFDFKGAGVTAADDGSGVVGVTIPGETFTAVAVEDEGVSQGNATTFDFVGAGVSVSVSAGTATVTISGGGGGGGVDVSDDGVSIITGATELDFKGAGVSVSDDGGGVAGITISGGGGGGGGAYFNGWSGTVGSLSGSGRAIKGMIITPDVDIDVSHVWGFIDGASAGLAHAGIIAEMTGTTSSDTVVSLIGTTSSINTRSTNLEPYRFAFASPVTLTAGQHYFVGVINQSGTGTTAVRVGNTSGSSSQAGINNHPGETTYAQVDFALTTLTASDAITGYTSGGFYTVWLEGREA
jgi:hypothetical protein